MMEITAVRMEVPEGANMIIGQAHFIKTAEDLYERMVTSAPGVLFGVAFSEASEKRLVRVEGNDEALKKAAADNSMRIGAGHAFVIVMTGAFPINVLASVKGCDEVCRIFCATANPLEVLVAETPQGRGIVGVVDGLGPLGVEGDADRAERKKLLRDFGYKL